MPRNQNFSPSLLDVKALIPNSYRLKGSTLSNMAWLSSCSLKGNKFQFYRVIIIKLYNELNLHTWIDKCLTDVSSPVVQNTIS